MMNLVKTNKIIICKYKITFQVYKVGTVELGIKYCIEHVIKVARAVTLPAGIICYLTPLMLHNVHPTDKISDRTI